MSVYPSLARPHAPGLEPLINFDDGIGNSGNGGRPNNPTIPPQHPGTFPRVNLNPKFKIGEYNNAEESYHLPRLNEYWKNRRNTNNPIGNYDISNVGLGVPGNAGNGYNKATAARRPMPWTPYDPQSLGVRGGLSQTYPYNENAMTVEGSLKLREPFGFNINRGEQQRVGAGFPLFEIKGEAFGQKVNLALTQPSGYMDDPGGGRPIPIDKSKIGSNNGSTITNEAESRAASTISATMSNDRTISRSGYLGGSSSGGGGGGGLGEFLFGF